MSKSRTPQPLYNTTLSSVVAPPSLLGQRPTYQRARIAPKTEASVIPVAAAPQPLTNEKRDLLDSARLLREKQLTNLTITGSLISLYSWKQMLDVAVVKIRNSQPVGPNSVNDPRMGVVDYNTPCQMCSQIDCCGHFGVIEFDTPIYNPAYIREVVMVLTCICNSCGKLLISEDVIRQKNFHRLTGLVRLSAMEKYCQNMTCISAKSFVSGGPIIGCVKNPDFQNNDVKEDGEIKYQQYNRLTGKKQANANKETMKISRVIEILESISTADAIRMGFAEDNHPRNLIMRGILVPPVIARPPVWEGGALHHDHLTWKFTTIVRVVADIAKGKPGSINDLYKTVKQLIFKSEGNKVGMKEFLSIVERIQGKTALLRNLLMGKRNNYCARTVAGPDSSLKFGQIRIPKLWEVALTKKIMVSEFNIDYLQDLFLQRKITHLTSGRTGLRKKIQFLPEVTFQLGDYVDRHLQNGDRVVINRQPTLHKQSMMAYEVVLGNQLSIGLHLSYTTPMNCDFDGDENNCYDPQDFEVEAEAEYLLNVKHNLASAEQNRPCMGMVMNTVTGLYLGLSAEETMVDPLLMEELLGMLSNKDSLPTLRDRLLKYGVSPSSGRAVFSATLPVDFYYDHKDIRISEGILFSGRLRKSHVGDSHRSIIQELIKNYPPERVAQFFTDVPWIVNKWIIERGFSVGLKDCVTLAIDPDTGLEYDKNRRALERSLVEVRLEIAALGPRSEDKYTEITRESKIRECLDVSAGLGLELTQNVMSVNNSIGTMIDQGKNNRGAGTKGNLGNIKQIIGSVGQQFYQGKRLRATITGGTRLLPSFQVNDLAPEASGFIANSFFTGISPTDLFFMQAGGREGLLDTALKTGEVGYISHKLVKALENIIIGNDGSIRNTVGGIFSPVYGSGYDSSQMILVKDISGRDVPSFIDIVKVCSELNCARGWGSSKDLSLINENKKRSGLQKVPLASTLPLIRAPAYLPPPPTPPPIPIRISRFEKPRIIGARAIQLSSGAPPLVDIDGDVDAMKIAIREYHAGVIPIFVVRRFSNGETKIVYPTLNHI